jgi:hypothetical protein
MKFLAIVSLFFAAANAEYIFSLTKLNKEAIVDMTCTFNADTEAGTAIEVRKYSDFMHNSTYTVNVFECHTTSYGSKCIGNVNETTCDTGYEGEFCRNYGGTDKLVKCH